MPSLLERQILRNAIFVQKRFLRLLGGLNARIMDPVEHGLGDYSPPIDEQDIAHPRSRYEHTYFGTSTRDRNTYQTILAAPQTCDLNNYKYRHIVEEFLCTLLDELFEDIHIVESLLRGCESEGWAVVEKYGNWDALVQKNLGYAAGMDEIPPAVDVANAVWRLLKERAAI